MRCSICGTEMLTAGCPNTAGHTRSFAPEDIGFVSPSYAAALGTKNRELFARVAELEAEVARLQRPDVVLAEATRLLAQLVPDEDDAFHVQVHRDGTVTADCLSDFCGFASLAEAYAALTSGLIVVDENVPTS